MATKLTPAQLAALDFLIAVGKQPPPAAAPATPAATTPPAAEATTAAPGAAAPAPGGEEKLINRGGLGGINAGGTTARFLDDIEDFVGDVIDDAEDAFEWADAVSAIEDLAEHLTDALNGLPLPDLEELGVRDGTGAVVPAGQVAATRKRPLSVDDLIALRDAQRKQ